VASEAGVLAGDPLECPPHPLVEAVPALAGRREHPIGFRLHVEGPEALAVLQPGQAVGLAGVHLAQVAVLAGDVEPEPGRDDRRRLDRPGQGARQQHVGPHPT
jgi:hypothetical protein